MIPIGLYLSIFFITVEIFSPEGSFPPFLICIPNTNSFLKDLIEFIAI